MTNALKKLEVEKIDSDLQSVNLKKVMNTLADNAME